MKKNILFLLLLISVFTFGQNRNALFANGIAHLKQIIISQIHLDSIGYNHEDSVINLIFTIKKNGKVKEINSDYDEEKTKAEFLRAARTISKK